MKAITVDGVRYVPESKALAEPVEGMPYVIVRTDSAGVFAGYLKSRNGKEATVLQARRIWYWDGAATLSQLAVDGPTKPASCKFPPVVPQVELTEVIEVLAVTAAAQRSIQEVPVWRA